MVLNCVRYHVKTKIAPPFFLKGSSFSLPYDFGISALFLFSVHEFDSYIIGCHATWGVSKKVVVFPMFEQKEKKWEIRDANNQEVKWKM